MNVNIRAARKEDLDAVVGIHMRAFRGFFLTTLGPRFLFELYRGFFSTPDGRLLVAEVDGKIGGFVAGTLAPRRFFRSLLAAHWWRFGTAALGAIIRRPHDVLPRVLSAIWYRGEAPSQLPGAALLSSIAVNPDISGVGIGRMLINAYCEEASKKGVAFVYLTTDRDRNDSTNRFYRLHDFEIESELRRRNGRVMIRYVRAL